MKHLFSNFRRLAALLLLALAWSAGAQAEERIDTIFSTVSGLEGDYTAPGLNTILTQEGNDWLLPMYKGAYYDGGSVWFYTMTEGIEGFENSRNSIDVRSKFQVTGKILEVMLNVGFNDGYAADDDLQVTIYAGPVDEATPHKTFTTTTHDIRSYYIGFDGVEVENATFNIRFTSKNDHEIQGVLLREIDIEYMHEVVSEDPLGVYVLGKELTTSTVNGSLGTGTYAYDPETRTMTISNAAVTVNYQTVISTRRSDLTVKLVGENIFTGGSAIATNYGPLTIIGVGEQASLTVNNGDSKQLSADYGYENLTIDNVAITLSTDTAAVMCDNLHMTNGASLKMSTDPGYIEWAAYPLCLINTLTLDEGISILTDSVTWNADRKKFLKGGAEVSEVEIGPEPEVVLINPALQFHPAELRVRYGQTSLSPQLINRWNVGPLEWTSSNEEIASVTDVQGYGVLTLNGIGRTYITVTFGGDDQFMRASATYSLEVLKGLPVIKFQTQSLRVLLGEGGQTQWPVATVNVEGAELTYASEDETVATVNATTGAVTLVAPGVTRIIARFAGNDFYGEAEGSYILTVLKPEAQAPQFTYYMENTPQVSAKLGATDNQLPVLSNPQQLTATYASSDESVASVNEFGEVTLNGLGTAWISALWKGNDQWQAAQTGYQLYVTQVEPITENTSITLVGDDLSGGNTNGVIGDNTTYSFNAEGGDSYDPATQTINLQSALSMQQIQAIVEQLQPGSEDFNNLFNGLAVLLSGGKGTVEIDCQTWGDYRLSVKIGDKEVATFEKTDRGTVVVNYDIDQDTYVYIFAMLLNTPAQEPQRATVRRAPGQEQTGLAISGLKVKPQELITTGIREVGPAATQSQRQGQTYDLQGRRVTGATRKGVYIVDGTKVVVK